MPSKARQETADLSVRELCRAALEVGAGATELRWILVPSEEKKDEVVEFMLADGYQCECELGAYECCSQGVVVVPGMAEVGQPIGEAEAVEVFAGTMPVHILVTFGSVAFEMMQGMSGPLAAILMLSGADVGRVTEHHLQEVLQGALTINEETLGDDLDKFLNDLQDEEGEAA
jgi:hypothetical protein